MSEHRIFGTDGVRGRAGEGWLAPDKVEALGRAVGHVLREEAAAAGSSPDEAPRALLGHDGRRSGPELEAALARGLAAEGYRPVSAGLITTPGLAYLGRRGAFAVTAMISASHNPAQDNGIKVFGASGAKLADDVEERIEARLRAELARAAESPPPAGSGDSAPPPLDLSLEEDYLAYLLSTVADLRLEGLVLALDCANGGASRVGPRVFGRLGVHAVSIAADPDGDNINDACGATQPGALQAEVLRSEARLGIALDGDGDRCILVDERGQIVHGDGILTLLARHAIAAGRLPDPRIVATVMSNRGLHRALRDVGVGVETVGVGDRRVVERMRQESLQLGGEQSGHIVFAENELIGDGLYTALRVLRVMQESGASLSELAAPYRPFPQVLVNVPVAAKPPLADMPALVEAVRAAEQHLGEDGRVLLRYSGTESLARVMVEGPETTWIEEQAHALAGLIAKEIGP